jgi:hypothetical protein
MPDHHELIRLLETPLERRDPACAAGRWCSISTEFEGDVTSDHCGNPRYACTLRRDGVFYRGSGGRESEQSGRIPAATARLLIEAVESATNGRGPLATHLWGTSTDRSSERGVRYEHGTMLPVFVVVVGPGEARYRVDFPQAPAIEGLLWQRLCEALPPGETGLLPAPPALLPEDP